LVQRLAPPRGQYHMRAACRQQPGEVAAEPGRSAGDECGLAVQSAIHHSANKSSARSIYWRFAAAASTAISRKRRRDRSMKIRATLKELGDFSMDGLCAAMLERHRDTVRVRKP